MRIVQMTDSHLLAAGALWKDALDTRAALEEAVAAVNRLAPDLVVHTGDVVENGDGPNGAAEYAAAAPVLARVEAPLRILPGNHDGRAAMQAAFPAQDWDEAAFLSFADEAAGLRLIGLDSTVPGQVGGGLCQRRLDWLARALDDRPTLIFMHHPPCAMDLPFMDGFAFEGEAALAELIAGRDVLRIACGHVHADAARHWGGTVVGALDALSAQISPFAPSYAAAGHAPDVMVEPLRLRVFDWGPLGLSVKTVPATPAGRRIPLGF